MTKKHNKLYYEQGRNGYVMSDTINPNMKDIKRKVSPVPVEQTTSVSLGKVSPKMKLSKEDLADLKEKVKENYTGVKNHHRIVKADVDYGKDKIPNYYIGKVYGYEARKVIEDFDLSYNIGTATTYLLRAKRKHSTSVECIQKAINHLEFELDKIKNEETDI